MLKVDGKTVATEKMEHTLPFILQWDENLDVGSDTGTPVDDSDYKVPFAFNGKIDKITLTIDRPKLTPEDEQKLKEAGRNKPGIRVGGAGPPAEGDSSGGTEHRRDAHEEGEDRHVARLGGRHRPFRVRGRHSGCERTGLPRGRYPAGRAAGDEDQDEERNGARRALRHRCARRVRVLRAARKVLRCVRSVASARGMGPDGPSSRWPASCRLPAAPRSVRCASTAPRPPRPHAQRGDDGRGELGDTRVLSSVGCSRTSTIVPTSPSPSCTAPWWPRAAIPTCSSRSPSCRSCTPKTAAIPPTTWPRPCTRTPILFPGDAGEAPSLYDPRARVARDLYNRALTRAFDSDDDGEVDLRAGVYPLPFGSLQVAFDPGSLEWGDRRLYAFGAGRRAGSQRPAPALPLARHRRAAGGQHRAARRRRGRRPRLRRGQGAADGAAAHARGARASSTATRWTARWRCTRADVTTGVELDGREVPAGGGVDLGARATRWRNRACGIGS